MKAKLVQFDVQKEEPVRNKQGFAVLPTTLVNCVLPLLLLTSATFGPPRFQVECKKGEAGELLAEIDDKDPIKVC